MKSIKKINYKKKFIITLIIEIVLFVFFIAFVLIPFLYGYDFNFIHADRIDTNNVTSVITIIISLIAVVVAIYIPKKIAVNQNKIALFEKRIEIYMVLLELIQQIDFLKEINIEKLEENKLSEKHYEYKAFTIKFNDISENDEKMYKVKCIQEYRQQEILLRQIEFLFDMQESYISTMKLFVDAYYRLGYLHIWKDPIKYKKFAGIVINNYSNIKKDIIPFIERVLRLK